MVGRNHYFTWSPADFRTAENVEETQDAMELRFKLASELIMTDLNQMLKGKELTSFKKIDEQLKDFYVSISESKSHEEQQVARIVLRSVSESLFLSTHIAMNPDAPFTSISNQILGSDSSLSTKILMTVLNGGKEFSSKVKL